MRVEQNTLEKTNLACLMDEELTQNLMEQNMLENLKKVNTTDEELSHMLME